MKLYKLTVEYQIVVAAEDNATASSVENNAQNYMLVNVDDIVTFAPDNALAEEVITEAELPSVWLPECLPFHKTKESSAHIPQLTIKQLLTETR